MEKDKKNISIDAKDIDDKILHPLINFNSLKGGKYTLYLDGEIGGKIDGEIRIIGGILDKFQTYNNLVAFANTIPALITFSSPGFNDNGYKIKEGVVEYSVDKNILRFKSIKIVGESSTIIGAGTINLKTKVSKIPVVGYILLGDNRSMAIGLSISGNLKNPKVETHAIKSMVELPFTILERLLKAPSNLLKRDRK
ncbi:Putative periplasmic protein [hydrothermal vent metagenome]|uniref:Putative periplasmic protein n=1 Tax=hydrothermal vent metagenome TaxID=652676 RepID=A0A1W1EIH6_9ZZZZ